MNRRDQVAIFRNPRAYYAGESGEGHSNRRDRAGLDDGKKSPAVEKTKQGRIRFPQVDIHSTSVRHHGRQFAVTQRARDGERPGHAPGHQKPSGAADVPRHLGRYDKDARPDHGPDNQHGRIEETQSPSEFAVVGGGSAYRRQAGCFDQCLPLGCNCVDDCILYP